MRGSPAPGSSSLRLGLGSFHRLSLATTFAHAPNNSIAHEVGETEVTSRIVSGP